MMRANCDRIGRLRAATLALMLALMLPGVAALAAGVASEPSEPGLARAAWLLDRESLQSLALTGQLTRIR